MNNTYAVILIDDADGNVEVLDLCEGETLANAFADGYSACADRNMDNVKVVVCPLPSIIRA